jgi:hypothetical protein
MRVDLDHAFILYVLVFLAGILGAWFSAVWARHRQSARHVRTLSCATCGCRVPLGAARKYLRCPRCGARNAVPAA